MKALVVSKKSSFDFYSNSNDKKTRDYAVIGPHSASLKSAKASHENTLESVVRDLVRMGTEWKLAYRESLAEVDIPSYDLIVAVGGDGTFLDASHYIRSTPILGVNSDPERSVGFYCAADAETFKKYLTDQNIEQFSRLEVKVDGKTLPLALNEILIAHSNPAAMTRYTLKTSEGEENIRSSGLLVCTPTGSGAWMLNAGGLPMDISQTEFQYLSRDSHGQKSKFAESISVVSHTREARIFVDGEHLSYPIELGSTINIGFGEPLNIIGGLRS